MSSVQQPVVCGAAHQQLRPSGQAPSLGSQAGLASALDMEVIRPCHCNDRILRLNPIPKAQENLIRFRAENAGNHDPSSTPRFTKLLICKRD